jgi:hypothetical protein
MVGSLCISMSVGMVCGCCCGCACEAVCWLVWSCAGLELLELAGGEDGRAREVYSLACWVCILKG